MSTEEGKPRVRRFKRWVGVLALVAAVVALAGPRPDVDTSVPRPSLPRDLDTHVALREAAFEDIKDGCDQRIVWVDPVKKERTKTSVVYLHGFSATRLEMAPFPERLAKALGANLFEARLTGHGRGVDGFADGTTSAWLRDGAEALEIGRRLGERVVVVGCSTGASLATWLASAGHTDGVAAFVFVSPNFAPRNGASRVLTWPWGRQIARLSVGEYREWTPSNERHAYAWTWRYKSHVLVEMQALVDLANSVDVGGIETPLLLVYSEQDRVVDPAAMKTRFAGWGGANKRLVAFTQEEDPSHHVLGGDILSPGSTDALVELALEFVRGT